MAKKYFQLGYLEGCETSAIVHVDGKSLILGVR